MSKLKALAGSVSGESLELHWFLLRRPCSGSSQGRRSKGTLWGVLFIRILIPFMRAPPL